MSPKEVKDPGYHSRLFTNSHLPGRPITTRYSRTFASIYAEPIFRNISMSLILILLGSQVHQELRQGWAEDSAKTLKVEESNTFYRVLSS